MVELNLLEAEQTLTNALNATKKAVEELGYDVTLDFVIKE